MTLIHLLSIDLLRCESCSSLRLWRSLYMLLWLLQLFNATIESSEKSDQLAERLKICLRETTMTIYNNVARYGIILSNSSTDIA